MLIDLNCDLGEGFPYDAELMLIITSANIACGYHAGDRDIMRRTVELALQHGVNIGAHPGFDDKEHFGRRELQLSDQAYYDLLAVQLHIMAEVLCEAGVQMKHVKPHGALYNMSARDPKLANIIAQAVLDYDPALVLFGLSGSASITEAEKLGLKTMSEVFADRSYQPDGSLTPRSLPGALIKDEEMCRQQVYDMAVRGKVRALDGTEIPILAQTICLHGDGDHAVEFAKTVAAALAAETRL